jgi:uncharacterized protein
MYRVHSIKRTRSEPSGPDSAGRGGQRPAPQPHQAPRAGSVSLESGRDSRRMGHCGESTQGRRAGALCHLDARLDAAVSGAAAGCGCAAGHAANSPAGNGSAANARAFLKTFLLALIGFYRTSISPALPSSCRFYPTCSTYAYEAVSTWGVLDGLRLTLKRLGRCRPFGPFGYDPVPEKLDPDPRGISDFETEALL